MARGMRDTASATAGFVVVLMLGLVAVGQPSTGDYSFEAELPLVIGDVNDPFRYSGEQVRELRGSATFAGDTMGNEGVLLAVVSTTAESGPIVVSESLSLQGVIRIVMNEFLGTESFMSGGLAESLLMHGDSGVMASVMPELFAEVAGWGLLDVYVNGALVFDDLPGHFMVTERVRRDAFDGYAITRRSDGTIYSPELEDKTGFVYSTERELHLWAASTVPGIPVSYGEDVKFHLNFLLKETPAGGGGAIAPDPEEPEDPREPQDPKDPKEPPENAGPKGNNGIGNGEDDQPPGDPQINDDEDSVTDGNASGGKGKGKN